jgi:hypothetical protein
VAIPVAFVSTGGNSSSPERSAVKASCPSAELLKPSVVMLPSATIAAIVANIIFIDISIR